MKSMKAILVAALMGGAILNPAKAASNDELRIGISQEFENLNPLIMTMVASNYLYNLAGRALTSIDANGKWYPQLAKSIPSIENGGAKIITVDGKKTVQAVWEIKDTARWSDGKPVTCEDFQFSRDVAENANVSVGEKETYTQIAKVEWDAKTPQKCTFTYDKLRWDFYMLGRTMPLPKHIEAPIFEKFKNKKEGYETNSNYSKNPSMPGLYNGPYKVSEVKLGSHVTFVVNPYFYGQAPKIKKIVVKVIPNTGTLEANLRSGTIDLISVLGLTFDQAIAFDKKAKAEKLDMDVVFKPSLTYEHIDLDLNNPILKDLKVRKALVHAINREEMVQALFEGKQPLALHHMAKIDPWYTEDNTNVVKYPFSKRTAGKLLDEAGWVLNEKDGYRYKDGKKLSLMFMTTAGNKNREVVQVFLQNQWKAVGADVIIKNEPPRVFFGETTKKRKFGGMAMYAWVSSPESSPRSQMHSTSIPTDKNGWSGQNNPGWANAKVDGLIDTLDSEFDAKKRLSLVAQITKFYTDEVPVIPLYYRSDVAVVPRNIKNYVPTGHQFSETNAAENWEVVTK